ITSRNSRAARRDAPVNCTSCGREVQRRARQQRFCSKRCRQKANYGEKVARGDFSTRTIARPTNPPKRDNKFKALQRAKTLSSNRIFGPADVLDERPHPGRPIHHLGSGDLRVRSCCAFRRAASARGRAQGERSAIAGSAMSDAINAVQNRYTRVVATLPAAPGASAEAAAATAARQILTKIYPEQTAKIEETYAASLKAIPDGSAKAEGIKLGIEV